jgi:hypothetical protein
MLICEKFLSSYIVTFISRCTTHRAIFWRLLYALLFFKPTHNTLQVEKMSLCTIKLYDLLSILKAHDADGTLFGSVFDFIFLAFIASFRPSYVIQCVSEVNDYIVGVL